MLINWCCLLWFADHVSLDLLLSSRCHVDSRIGQMAVWMVTAIDTIQLISCCLLVYFVYKVLRRTPASCIFIYQCIRSLISGLIVGCWTLICRVVNGCVSGVRTLLNYVGHCLYGIFRLLDATRQLVVSLVRWTFENDDIFCLAVLCLLCGVYYLYSYWLHALWMTHVCRCVLYSTAVLVFIGIAIIDKLPSPLTFTAMHFVLVVYCIQSALVDWLFGEWYWLLTAVELATFIVFINVMERYRPEQRPGGLVSTLTCVVLVCCPFITPLVWTQPDFSLFLTSPFQRFERVQLLNRSRCRRFGRWMIHQPKLYDYIYFICCCRHRSDRYMIPITIRPEREIYPREAVSSSSSIVPTVPSWRPLPIPLPVPSHVSSPGLTFPHLCVFCLEDFGSNEMSRLIVYCDADHFICQPCAANCIRSAVGDTVNNRFPLVCGWQSATDPAHLKCTAFVKGDAVEQLERNRHIDADVLERYTRLCVNAAVAADSIVCPFSDCDRPIQIDAAHRHVADTCCPYCHRLFCIRCKAPHRGQTCAQYQTELLLRQQSINEQQSADLIWASSRQCPLCITPCRISHYRGHGCHHMTHSDASTGVGRTHEFCYVCVRPIAECRASPQRCPLFCNFLCSCLPCPLCRIGQPCEQCAGDCEVCAPRHE